MVKSGLKFLMIAETMDICHKILCGKHDTTTTTTHSSTTDDDDDIIYQPCSHQDDRAKLV